jgi:molecular chaperone DnaK
MKYVGIDLGTTNSAICSYDGENVRLYKSPEQFDVTPSAIYFDRRGNKYVGTRAYDNAARNPDNVAKLFKRHMGTSTRIMLPSVGIDMSPEECSTEVLRVLYSYLPEEIRNDDETGAVITVPAAFNQMQKDATMAAAQAAGIGRVALMQEPVAAVMSVMRQRNSDGIFVVFDLGGGTLDIAIAESTSGRVSLLAHGGIAMCGGRDFDRMLFDNIVKPWLLESFDLPENLNEFGQFQKLKGICEWAAEKAKIQLSQRDSAAISLDDSELGVRDQSGEDVYLDIEIDRAQFDALISAKLDEAIQSTRETLVKAGLTPHDVERIVFVGGPTQYKPLRDKVAFELGIAASTDVNPMTAVAEGAAVFAESIEWSSQSRGRKSSRGTVSAGGALELSFNYIARTPDSKARIVVNLGGEVAAGSEFQIDSLDTGWSSGRVGLKHGASIDVALQKPGENTFKVFVFDANGGAIKLGQDKITIARTAASVDAIPASHSIFVEALDKIGGKATIDYLVKEGDQLPKKGKRTYKSAESLKAGSAGAIRIKLWEGDIKDPIHDNRLIGTLKIAGSDFEDGVIPAGADLICEYEITDGGNILIEVSVPEIGGSFHSGRSFYSRQDGQIDYSQAAQLIEEQSQSARHRLDEIEAHVDDPRLGQARQKLDQAEAVDPAETDPEVTKQAMDNIQEAKRLLAMARQDNLKVIRQIELDRTVDYFDRNIREFARSTEATSFDNLARTAQRSIDSNTNDFEVHLDELRGKNFSILWRQDWFVVERFKWLAGAPHLFSDGHEHEKLVLLGAEALKDNEIEKLRNVVAMLDSIRFNTAADDELLAGANIVRGG